MSIAAGTTLANLEAGLGPIAIVRAMPNTPAQVGRGITAAVANAKVGDGRQGAGDIGSSTAVGEVVWVDDEALIDAVTAVSGSGPAYVFLLAECLDGGGDRGRACRRRRARELARATVDRRRRASPPLRPAGRAAPQERHLARRHDGGGAEDPDGRGRLRPAHEEAPSPPRRSGRRNCRALRAKPWRPAAVR